MIRNICLALLEMYCFWKLLNNQTNCKGSLKHVYKSFHNVWKSSNPYLCEEVVYKWIAAGITTWVEYRFLIFWRVIRLKLKNIIHSTY